MQEESAFKVVYRCNRTIQRHTNCPLADPTRLCLDFPAALEDPAIWESAGLSGGPYDNFGRRIRNESPP
jgi:hypothetical protein